MMQAQRVIKYFAIAFALFLTFNIISSIMFGILTVANIFDDNNDYSYLKEIDKEDEFFDITKIDIDISTVNLTLKRGDTFKVETSSDRITYRNDNGNLIVKEKDYNFYNKGKDQLIISIPKTQRFDSIDIDNGAGLVDISEVNTKEIKLDLGAGSLKLSDLIVLEKAKINGGAGEIIIKESNINNLDLDIGVGRCVVDSKIVGDIDIDSGIGEVDITIEGKKEDYHINLNKGLGSVKIDDEKILDDIIIGNGKNKMKIDGGVGSIKIKFSN